MAATATERIVVRTTPQEKTYISAKAKKLGLPVSELMRRGASAYNPAEEDDALDMLADAAMLAAHRASNSIDNMLAYVAASAVRIGS